MQRTLARALYLAILTAGVTTLSLPALAAPIATKTATAATGNMKIFTPTTTLDVLQVTQTKRPARKTPAGTIVLTAADLERGHYRSLVDALEDCPGITIGRTGYGDGEQYIRINGEERVLVLMDGRRLNVDLGIDYSNGGFDASTIPDPELIERVEILKGAAGSLYGSGAVGGVVNIITKRATGNYIKLDGAMGQLQTYKYNGTLSARRGKYGLLVTGGTYHQKDMRYKDAGTHNTETLASSKWEEDSFGVKLDREINADKLLTLHYQHSFKEGRTPGGVEWMNDYYKPMNQLERLNNALSLRYDWNKDKDNAGFVNVYHSYYTDRHWNTRNNGDVFKFVSNENRNGVDAGQNFRLSRNNTLALGASWRHSAIDSDLFFDEDEKETIDNKAIYLSDAWDFTPSLSLTSGLRYDHYNTSGGKTTASLGLNKELDKTSNVYLNWGTFFHAPEANMLYQNSAYTGSWNFGNADLRPETGSTWSVGYNKQFNAKTDLSLSYFHSNLHDAFNWLPDSSHSYYTAVNSGDETKQGFTLAAKHKFSDRWLARASYSYVHIDYDLDNSPNLLNYPHQYKVSVDYTLPKFRAQLAARGGSGGDRSFLGNKAFADSSFFTMDLALDYQFTKGWSMYGKIYNLTNASYTELAGTENGSNLYPMPSRYFVIGAVYKF